MTIKLLWDAAQASFSNFFFLKTPANYNRQLKFKITKLLDSTIVWPAILSETQVFGLLFQASGLRY